MEEGNKIFKWRENKEGTGWQESIVSVFTPVDFQLRILFVEVI